MKWFFKLLALTRFFSSWNIKNKYGWIGSLIYPLCFYVILTVVGGTEMSSHAIVGALIALLWRSGVGILPQHILRFNFIKLKEMFVAAPIHPLMYMLGASISVLIASLPPMVPFIVLLIAYVNVTFIELFYLMLVLLAAWLMSSALGFVVAGYIKDPTKIGTIAPWTSALLTTLPPVYYPLAALPRQYRVVALIVPTTHLAEAAKISVKITIPSFNPLIHGVSIFVYMMLFLFLAGFKSRWREK